MINFRYHIVSITAVFLALGIGTALGSTFLDGPTVDLLNRNIRNAENRIAATEAENTELSRADERARARDLALLLDGGERLLGNLLVDRPTMVIIGPGVDGATADGVRQALTASGTDLRATMILDDRLAFDDDLDLDLATDLGLVPTTPAALRQAVNRELAAALVAAGRPVEDVDPDGDPETDPGTDPDLVPGTDPAPDPDPDPGTEDDPAAEVDPEVAVPTVPDGTQPTVVTTLAERDYLDLEPGPGGDPGRPVLETTGYRYVIVTSDDVDRFQTEIVLRLLQAVADDEDLPAVVVAPTGPDPDEDDAVEGGDVDVIGTIRADDDLRGRHPTVDDIDAFSGLVATVFVLEEIHAAAPGHYGQGDDAQSVLPPGP